MVTEEHFRLHAPALQVVLGFLAGSKGVGLHEHFPAFIIRPCSIQLLTDTPQDDFVFFEVVDHRVGFGILHNFMHHAEAFCLCGLQSLHEMSKVVVVLVAGEVQLADDTVGFADVFGQYFYGILRDVVFLQDAEHLLFRLGKLISKEEFARPLHAACHLRELLDNVECTVIVERCGNVP